MSTIDDIASDRTLPGLINRHARERPSAAALSFAGTSWTYSEFAAQMDAVSGALDAAGFVKGDRIAYLGKNSAELAFLWAGAALREVVLVPLNWRLAPGELIEILADAGARALFIDPDYRDLEPRLAGALPGIDLFVHCGESGPQGFAQWSAARMPREPLGFPGNDAVAVQLYTSGTTGLAKGVSLTHDSLFWQRAASEMDGIACDCQSADDILLVSLTASHVGGLVTFARAFFAGAHAVVIREFDTGAVLDAIAHYRVSRLTVVPSTLQMLVRDPRVCNTDTRSVRIIQYGASPIPLELLEQSLALFQCAFVQVYGMTETGGAVATLPPEDHGIGRAGRMKSIGVPLPGVTMRVVDADGKNVRAGTIGEIQVRSRATMLGYTNLAEETAAAFTLDGFFRTGDAGYVDADGYYYLCDRIKDMIVTGAENVYPAEVEQALYGHPDVSDVAVIGVPDDRWGEAVKAIVVRHPGGSVSETDLIAYSQDRIARYKAPKSIDFVEALPRNTAGKILRRLLAEPYWAGRERRIN